MPCVTRAFSIADVFREGRRVETSTFCESCRVDVVGGEVDGLLADSREGVMARRSRPPAVSTRWYTRAPFSSLFVHFLFGPDHRSPPFFIAFAPPALDMI